MNIIPQGIRDLRRRAEVCLEGIREALASLDNPERWNGPVPMPPGELASRVVADHQRRMAEASADFDGRSDLLWLIEVAAAGVFDGWPDRDPKYHAPTAHAWLLLCGSILSRWDRRLYTTEDADGEKSEPFAWVDMPDGRIFHLEFDRDFRSMLDVAPGALELEHSRAGIELLRSGRLVSTPARVAAEERPAEQNPWQSIELSGNERRILDAVTSAGGRLDLDELCRVMKWSDPVGDEWKAAKKRLRKKLSQHGWSIRQQAGCAVLSRTAGVGNDT